jgi:hypothetical protein
VEQGVREAKKLEAEVIALENNLIENKKRNKVG